MTSVTDTDEIIDMTDEDEIISFDLPDTMLESEFFTKCGMSKLEFVQLHTAHT